MIIVDKIYSRLKRLVEPEPGFTDMFNVPVKFAQNDWYVNERIVEMPFVLSQFDLVDDNETVLDFGCTRSLLSTELASLGFRVTGIDLRRYEFGHPNLTVLQTNLKQMSTDEQFDYIVSISVLEHVGLGAYREPKDSL